MYIGKPLMQMSAADIMSVPNFMAQEPPREVFRYRCSECGEPCGEAAVCGGEAVCPDCWEEYRRKRLPEYYDKFIASRPEVYLYNWWLEGMDAHERRNLLLRIVSAEYRRQKKLDKLVGRHELEKEEADFCTSTPDFYDFVEEQLRGGAS